MNYATKTGARSVYFVGPHPSHNGGGKIVHRELEQSVEVKEERKVKKKALPDTTVCAACNEVVPSKVVRATPKMGIVCQKCIVKLGSKCYL